MTCLVTGAAGFIGCRLVVTLLRRGAAVAGFDNLCRGSLANLRTALEEPNFTFRCVDLSDIDAYRKAFTELHERTPITEVWHLAANSDIPAGAADPRVDLRDTFLTTLNSLILMREFGVGLMAFASSSAIYGDHGVRSLREDDGPLLPISSYGAMKLASEAAISAAVEAHLERAFLFRFPNVIGTPATHGIIYDFVRKLRLTPSELNVLGDGTQQKSYLHVEELIDAMLLIRERARARLNYFNIGADDDGVTVKYIAEAVVERCSPGATIVFGHGNRGWVGDVPRFKYSIEKLSALGWRPTLGSAAAIQRAVAEIADQEFAR